MDLGPSRHETTKTSPLDGPGGLMEPRTCFASALAWARASGATAGPAQSPPPGWLLPLAHAWMAAHGWHVRPTWHDVGKALSVLGCPRVSSTAGRKAYRVPKALAESWWEQVGGRPKRKRRAAKKKPHQRAVKPLFHTGLNPASRPILDSLGRVYPSLGAAAAVAGEGEGNWKGLHNALRAVRNGEALWGKWRSLLWRYLSQEETAMVPWGTRTGAVPVEWGFGPLRASHTATGIDGVRENRASERLIAVGEVVEAIVPCSLGRQQVTGGVSEPIAQVSGVADARPHLPDVGGEALDEGVDSSLGVGTTHGVTPSWCDGGGV
jgi:hypothetical protein